MGLNLPDPLPLLARTQAFIQGHTCTYSNILSFHGCMYASLPEAQTFVSYVVLFEEAEVATRFRIIRGSSLETRYLGCAYRKIHIRIHVGLQVRVHQHPNHTGGQSSCASFAI